MPATVPATVAVLHDLSNPLPGYKANIDHVIVRGREVVIVDSKQWAGGRYWTLFGVTRRGWARVSHADSKPSLQRRLRSETTFRPAPSSRDRSSSSTATVSDWACINLEVHVR